MGWYSRFIERELEYKAPLTKLLRKTQAWKWGDEQLSKHSSWQLAPVLALPDFSKPFKIQCDASGVTLVLVRLQEDDEGKEHHIVYLSRTLNKHEGNYTVVEKELLAVIWSIKNL